MLLYITMTLLVRAMEIHSKQLMEMWNGRFCHGCSQCRIKTLEALVHSEKWGPLSKLKK